MRIIETSVEKILAVKNTLKGVVEVFGEKFSVWYSDRMKSGGGDS